MFSIQFPAPTTTCEWHVYAWGLRYFPDELGRLKAPRKFPGHVISLGQWLVDAEHKQIDMVRRGQIKKKGYELHKGRRRLTGRPSTAQWVKQHAGRAGWKLFYLHGYL